MSKLDSGLHAEAWIEAFAAQCTETLYEDARRFAARRAALVRRAGGHVDEYYARELVEDVVSDTWSGVLQWDPAAQSLAGHVWDAIRTRTHHDWVRAHKYRRESFDVLDGETAPSLVAEVEAALASGQPPSMVLTAEVHERLAALREHAADQPMLVRLLDAFEAGATSKADVMHVAGLTDREYHAARVRLARLLTRLSCPEPIRKGA